jgi:hypothetical protein
MPRLISKDHLERVLAKAEEVLNLVGYIPLISLISATVRTLGGMLQLILGVCFAAGHFFFLGFSKTRKITHFFHLKASLAHALHGFCNVLRATIEAIPFLSLTLCLPYDRMLKKRFKYPIENYPIVLD